MSVVDSGAGEVETDGFLVADNDDRVVESVGRVIEGDDGAIVDMDRVVLGGELAHGGDRWDVILRIIS